MMSNQVVSQISKCGILVALVVFISSVTPTVSHRYHPNRGWMDPQLFRTAWNSKSTGPTFLVENRCIVEELRGGADVVDDEYDVSTVYPR